MEMKAETSKVLMSEALRGRLPEDMEDEAATSPLEANMVTVVLHMQFGAQKTAVVGILRSVLFENEPEVESKVQLDEALTIVSAEKMVFLGFELHHGERVIPCPGPFAIKGARIDDIDIASGMCLLSLGLKRPLKT